MTGTWSGKAIAAACVSLPDPACPLTSATEGDLPGNAFLPAPSAGFRNFSLFVLVVVASPALRPLPRAVSDPFAAQEEVVEIRTCCAAGPLPDPASNAENALLSPPMEEGCAESAALARRSLATELSILWSAKLYHAALGHASEGSPIPPFVAQF
jgi:hypothetical protein